MSIIEGEVINGIEFSEDLTTILKIDTNLHNITIEEWVETLGIRSFFYCRFISSINLPKGLIKIGDWCFEGCSELKSLKLYSKTIHIGAGAFYNCSNLDSIVLGNKIERIYKLTFYGCSKLSKIKLPNKLKYLDVTCFKKCYILSEIEYKGMKYKCSYDKVSDSVIIEGLGIFDGIRGGEVKVVGR